MKNITKLIATTAAVVALFTTNVKAQSSPLGQVKFDIGLDGGVPTYNARQLSSVMGGATGRFQLGLGDNLNIIATSGYYNLFDKNTTVDGSTVKAPGLGIIPVKFGLKGYLGGGVYLTGEAGEGFETSKDLSTNSKDIKGLLSAGLGYTTHSGWDVGARYESFTGQSYNYGLIALSIAYGFTL